VADFPATKAKRVLAALKRIGWREKAKTGGSHVTLSRDWWGDYTWALGFP